MWTHLDSWANAAAALEVTISGPVALELKDGTIIRADMLVSNFGARCGTLVSTDYMSLYPYRDQIHAAGYTYSSFGPENEGVECSSQNLIEVLSEWGWCGPGAAPAWIIQDHQDSD